MSYQPGGDLWIDQDIDGNVADYRRSLDLETATAAIGFRAGGTKFKREVVASPADGVIVVRLIADRPGSVSFTLSLTSEQWGGRAVAEGSRIAWRGRNRDSEGIAGRLTFEMRAHVSVDGGAVVRPGAGLR